MSRSVREIRWHVAGTLSNQPTNKHTVPCCHRLVGLVVRRPPRERKVPGSNPACGGIFSGSSHTSDLNIGAPVLTCQAPGVIGSALGLVGPVSVYCDWVRWKIFDLQLLSQCDSTSNCLSRSVPEIHSHVAWTLSNQPSNNPCCPTMSRLQRRVLPTDLPTDFLEFVVRGFLRVLRFPPLLHRLMVQPMIHSSNKCHFISVKLNS